MAGARNDVGFAVGDELPSSNGIRCSRKGRPSSHLEPTIGAPGFAITREHVQRRFLDSPAIKSEPEVGTIPFVYNVNDGGKSTKALPY